MIRNLKDEKWYSPLSIFNLGTHSTNPSSSLFVVESGIIQCFLSCTLIKCQFAWTWVLSPLWSVNYLIHLLFMDLHVDRLHFKLFGWLWLGQAFNNSKNLILLNFLSCYCTESSCAICIYWKFIKLPDTTSHSTYLLLVHQGNH